MSSALSELQSPPPKPKWWKPLFKPIPLFDPFQINSTNQSNPRQIDNSFSNLQLNQQPIIFGCRLEESLQKASVAISMIGHDNKAYIYGFIPVVVAKCGLYLKERGTNIQDLDWRRCPLQSSSNNLDQSNLDQKPYFSVHDASSVLRRYLMSLPEPLIPHSMYQDFREILSIHQNDKPKQIKLFKSLISTLSPSSQYLLLYLLDLLSVFANRSDLNLMTANNLAVVFQPALCPIHPSTTSNLHRIIYAQRAHDPQSQAAIQQESLQEQEIILKEGKLAQAVLEFMILNQNHFVIGLRPPIKSASSTHIQTADLQLEDRSQDDCQTEDELSHPSTPRPQLTSRRRSKPQNPDRLQAQVDRTKDIKRSRTLPSNTSSPKDDDWNGVLRQTVGTPVPSAEALLKL
ncbi:hypothetical protein O181_056628 [Austropuccinia psidii MF-1]|uniref:Rho-GAP domain-containing protein n=1 Tax=Austropuccinia psidii MF-1 TaxID=1389203 RepID=A0A9Q3EDF9_9BASI|nr:hypothetical protein [Austropuccinia psidii MF-1]